MINSLNNINYVNKNNIAIFFVVIFVWWAFWELLSYVSNNMIRQKRASAPTIYISSILFGTLILIMSEYSEFFN
jgi:hypothetical protein